MQTQKTTYRVIPAALALLLTLPLAALGAGDSPAASAPGDPKAMAKDAYNRALKYRDKAWEYEAKATAATDSDSDREKFERKAGNEYEKAVKALKSAVTDDPAFYQAHSLLGYALRKLGDYESSLAAYDRALELNPSYAEAIEYRAEAHLGLNRLDEAKAAYMELFRTDRKRAGELMDAMQEWVAVRQADAAGVDATVIGEFSSWVQERAQLAEQAGDISGGSW